VESNYEIGKGPPRVDLLIIRKVNKHWTEKQLKYLPDGVRHSKRQHIILEFKKTQPISVKSVWQSMGYLNSYLNFKNIKPGIPWNSGDTLEFRGQNSGDRIPGDTLLNYFKLKFRALSSLLSNFIEFVTFD